MFYYHIFLLFSVCSSFLLHFSIRKTNIKKNMFGNDYYNFDEPLSYDIEESVYNITTLIERNISFFDINNMQERSVYTKDTFLDDVKENIRQNYGAYKDHNTKNDKKVNKKKKEKKYLEEQFKKIKDNKEIKKEDKPIVFLVDPKQLNIYKAYNRTMSEAKKKRDEEKNQLNNNKNNTLPENFTDDEFYIWF